MSPARRCAPLAGSRSPSSRRVDRGLSRASSFARSGIRLAVVVWLDVAGRSRRSMDDQAAWLARFTAAGRAYVVGEHQRIAAKIARDHEEGIAVAAHVVV